VLTESEDRVITEMLESRDHLVILGAEEWLESNISGLLAQERVAITSAVDKITAQAKIFRTGIKKYGLRPVCLKQSLPNFKFAVPLKENKGRNSPLYWNRAVPNGGIKWCDQFIASPNFAQVYEGAIPEGLEGSAYDMYRALVRVDTMPALLPQVSLPYRKRDGTNSDSLIDFLIVPSRHQAIVIHTDGKKHHYFDVDQQKRDAELDLDLIALGYDVRRIKGIEFGGVTDTEARKPIIMEFWMDLLREYGRLP
jgi:hypothetical protein